MPVTRSLIRGVPKDEFGYSAYSVIGSPIGESYTTTWGDYQVDMRGGNDTVNMALAWTDGIGQLSVQGGDGHDRLLARGAGSGTAARGGPGNDYVEIQSGDDEAFAWGGDGNDVLRAVGDGGSGEWLYGNKGADRLHATPNGISHLNGGVGVDQFYLTDDGESILHFFNGHTGTAEKRDHVWKFDPVPDPDVGGFQDIIDLNGIDANRNIAGNQDFIWDGKMAIGAQPVNTGHAGFFQPAGSDNIVAVWNSAGAREAVVLHDIAHLGDFGKEDFYL